MAQQSTTMDFNSTDSLRVVGFWGLESVSSLWQDRSSIPKQIGVYMVLNPDPSNPQFILPGVGGFFKGRDPNLSIDKLRGNFVKDSLVLYIGKAGSSTAKATLHSRLGQYLKFGQGKNIGH